jgi:hypothetical protein
MNSETISFIDPDRIGGRDIERFGRLLEVGLSSYLPWFFPFGFSQTETPGTSLGMLLLPAGILAVINYYNKASLI